MSSRHIINYEAVSDVFDALVNYRSISDVFETHYKLWGSK